MSVKKRGLGKGLSALISDEEINLELIDEVDKTSKDLILNIDIDKLVANKEQPRVDFDQESLKDLAGSIKLYGLIQPILVRKVKDKYEIIAGERRWRASQIAGLEKIPSLVKELDEEESAKLALIENIQREDLNPIEEALGYRNLMEEFKLTQEDLSLQIGKSRSYIANSLRLLNLNEEIMKDISTGRLTPGHGKALLSLKDKEEQLEVAKDIIKYGLNVRETEDLASSRKNRIQSNEKEYLNDSYTRTIEESLMMTLGTKVNIISGSKKGKIEIEYYGDEDLERIIDILTG